MKKAFELFKKAVCMMLGFVFLLSAVSCAEKQEGEGGGDVVPEIAESEIMLVENGKSAYSIVVPQEANERETFAAQELQDIFYKSTGYTLPIIDDASAVQSLSEHYIALGETTLKELAKVSADTLKATGYTLQLKENTLVIVGNTPIATLYGVYEFMERNLGYMFYADDEVYVESLYNKALLDFDFVYEPPITYLQISHYSTNTAYTSERRRVRNAPGVRGWPHSFKFTVSPTKYPQFYKSGNTSTLCISDRAMWDVAAEKIIGDFLEYEDLEYYCLAQEDVRGTCQCADCEASNDKYTYTGSYMIFSNYVARKVKEYFAQNDPSREPKIMLLAYFNSEQPPVKTVEIDGEETVVPIDPAVVAEDNVYIQVCPIWQDFASSLTAPSNAVSYNMLKNWKVIVGDRIWTYIYDGFEVHNNMFFFFDWEYKVETMRILADLGYQELMWETSPKRLISFEKLRFYHTTSLMFNPNKDSNQLISDFITHYYKEAAPYIQRYFDTVNMNFKIAQAKLAEENKILGQFLQISMNKYLTNELVWPELMIEQILGWFDEAIAAIENSDAYTDLERVKMLARVRQEQIFPRYYQLLLYKNSFTDSAYRAAVEKFNADVAEFGGTVFIPL